MKVLFICSHKKETNISPFVKSQGESLLVQGIEVSYFVVKRKGFIGYLKSIPELRKYIRSNPNDVYHAHYSFCAFLASLAGCKPLIVSLLGSDVISKKRWLFLIRIFNKFYKWKAVIVKSSQMKELLKIDSAQVIPNGVNMDDFYPMNKNEARKQLNWDLNQKIVLFNGQKGNFIKNFDLALQIQHSSSINFELVELKNYSKFEINLCYNACDVFLSTSLWEGSPNTIKEAMSCNTPILASNVGDIQYLFSTDSGNLLSTLKLDDFVEKIEKLLKLPIKNNGRQKILALNLDSKSVAKKIKTIYINAVGS